MDRGELSLSQYGNKRVVNDGTRTLQYSSLESHLWLLTQSFTVSVLG